MPLIRTSPCKVNLLLNILGRRPDGFHDLETPCSYTQLTVATHVTFDDEAACLLYKKTP